MVPEALHSLAARSNVVQRNFARIPSENPKAFWGLHLHFARALLAPLAPSRPKTTWQKNVEASNLQPNLFRSLELISDVVQDYLAHLVIDHQTDKTTFKQIKNVPSASRGIALKHQHEPHKLKVPHPSL